MVPEGFAVMRFMQERSNELIQKLSELIQFSTINQSKRPAVFPDRRQASFND
jgi:hypothetical protein